MKSPTASDIDIHALERETGFGWGWFISLGVAHLTLGALAFLNLAPEATVSLYAIGILMLIGAFSQLATLILVPGWKGKGVLVLSAVSYGAAGVLVIENPVLAAEPLAVMLALALVFSGTVRIWLSRVMPSLPGCGWIMASGLLTVVAGIAFTHLLFIHPVWHLGVVLAVDLTFQGAMAIAFGIALKAIST